MTAPLHLLACPYAAQGHVRPSFAFVANVVENHPEVIFTVLIFRTYVAAGERELERSRISEAAAKRIRIIGLSEEIPAEGYQEGATTMAETFKLVPILYGMIVNGAPVRCTATGNVFEYADIPPPQLIFNDWLYPYCGQAFKAITPAAKIVILWIGTAGICVRWAGPKELGGWGSWESDTKAEMEKKEMKAKTMDEACQAVMNRYMNSGVPHLNPDGIRWYDYEMWPQKLYESPEFSRLLWESIRSIHTFAEGIVICTVEAFEPKSSLAIRKWIEEGLGKHVFFTGPLSSEKLLSASGPEFVDHLVREKHSDVFRFMDAQERGSVWLISFGTIYYSFLTPRHLIILINILLKTGTPFILVQAGGQAGIPLPKDTIDTVAGSEMGLILDSVPQQELLLHPNMGVFVTHGGANSTFETIATAVLPVFWPFAGDQCFHAAYVTQIRDAGFELIQVRTGFGAQNPLRGPPFVGTDEAIASEIEEVVAETKGQVGERKRRNLKTMRDELEEAFTGGDVRKAIEQVIAFSRT